MRWLKFCKYLPEMGIEPIVYAPANADYPTRDDVLTKQIPSSLQVLMRPIREPNSVFKKLTFRKDTNYGSDVFSDKSSWMKRQALKIRANYFIPDSRMFWIKPSVKYLREYLEENPVDILITNGTPHSCHVIGFELKQLFPDLPWLADFRDPWMEIDFFEELNLSARARASHEQLEKAVLTTADAITTVSPSWADLFAAKGGKNIHTITNGYDIDDFHYLKPYEKQKPYLISHVGTLNASRNAESFWAVLHQLQREQPQLAEQLEVLLVGPIDQSIQAAAEQLGGMVRLTSSVPHKAAISIMKASDILWLANNSTGATKGRIPAKLFEYIGAEKPILYTGSLDNDAAHIIQTHQLGHCMDFHAAEGGMEFIQKTLAQPNEKSTIDPTPFQRKTLTQQLVNVLHQLVK